MQKLNEVVCFHGEPGGTRTRDHRIKSAMLYQLSYRPAKFTDIYNIYKNIIGPPGTLGWQLSPHDEERPFEIRT